MTLQEQISAGVKARNLREHRSMLEAAEMIGIHVNSLYNFLNGKWPDKETRLHDIADYAGYTIELQEIPCQSSAT